MDAWAWGLLIKPLAAILVIAVVIVLPILLAKMLRPLFPEGRLKEWLFRNRGGDSASSSADTTQCVLDNPAITVRQVGEDRPRL